MTFDQAMASPPQPAASKRAAPAVDDRARENTAAARRVELADAEEAVDRLRKAAAGGGPPKRQSVAEGIRAFVAPLVAAGEDEEEAAGWLEVRDGDDWTRLWASLATGDLGPALDLAQSPGAPRAERILLAGCEVDARIVDDDRFAFVVSHAHQRPREFSTQNKLTRRQWVSVLTQVVRDHAKKSRAADLKISSPAGRQLKAAERRLSLAQAREDGDR